jgi:hypothetical protein
MRLAIAPSCALVFVLALLACGDNIYLDTPHDAAIDAPPSGVCGNGELEPGEECDSGNIDGDEVCDATCRLTCGNGVVDDWEACDTAIAEGEGACPAACDDGDACTSDILSGSECQATCLHAEITAPQDGDGCCPAGASSLTDDDCPVVCGNGVVEDGEQCDTGIAAGEPGACPTACDDGLACTTDSLLDAGTCTARCEVTAITEPADGDGCCPPGAHSGNDDDCPPGCDNGFVDEDETCDTAIPAGEPGACPTSCEPDGVACTAETLANPGTCLAECLHLPIVTPIDGDGCCPPGANANNDSDCEPACGNGVVEEGEECDEAGPGCVDCRRVTVPTAFRFTALTLKDPHTYVRFVFCIDVTNPNISGFSVNGELATALTSDGDGDGLLDLSPVDLFRPLAQGQPTSPLEVHFADCAVGPPVTCSPGAEPPIESTARNQAAGTCLGILPGTVRPYSPAVTATTAPCFVSDEETLTIELSGIPITLRDTRIAATYVGNPATGLVNGLLRGFISEADADATILPSSLPIVGGQPLSRLLPGGSGNCASHNDKDMHGGVPGWWFYLNYSATATPWTEP